MPEVTVTRRLTFDAAHRVHNAELSAQENAAVFGKCNNPHGHGHTYVLEVSVTGAVDARTGYVIDLGALKRAVEEHVVGHMDHRNLNADVAFLRGINPTAENIVVACWRELEPRVRPGRLTRLRLWETPNNHVDYEGR
jgi:6-pyruvoyltetrahydropterin/6-carboxytetrahydropterin synthase